MRSSRNQGERGASHTSLKHPLPPHRLVLRLWSHLFIYHLITLRPDLAFACCLRALCEQCMSGVTWSVPFGLNGLGPHIGGFSTDGSFLSTPIHLPHSAPPAWLFPPTSILIHSLFIQERRLLHRRTSNTYHLLVTSEQLLLLVGYILLTSF
jgi:hypothetical protein